MNTSLINNRQPTQLSIFANPHITLSKDRLTATYNVSNPFQQIGCVRSDFPISNCCSGYYFEIKILKKSPSSKIIIGLTNELSSINQHPGSDEKSVGFMDEGRLYIYGNTTAQNFGEAFTKNDIIGCGIVYETKEIFFTKNGSNLGKATTLKPYEFFPTAGMSEKGDSVVFTFKEPFLFDFNSYMNTQKDIWRSKISQISIDYINLNTIIKAYLLHRGYKTTYNSFMKAINKETSKEELKNEIKNEEKDSKDKDELKENISLNAKESPNGNKKLFKSDTIDHQVINDFEITSDSLSILEKHLQIRHDIKQKIVEGQILEAIILIEENYPNLLKNDPPSLAIALLYSQQLIEIMRNENPNILNAVNWMREKMCVFMDSPSPIKDILMECSLLICNLDEIKPEIKTVFDQSRRILAADKINLLIIEKGLQLSEWSPLDLIVRHLVTCKQSLRRYQGSVGQISTCYSVCHPFYDLLLNENKSNK